MRMLVPISIAILVVMTAEAFLVPHRTESPFFRQGREKGRRRGRPAREPYYDDDYQDDDEFYYHKSREPDNLSFRAIGNSPEERELRRIPFADEVLVEDVDVNGSLEVPRKRPQMQRYDNQESDEDDYREREPVDLEDDEPAIGNFWSNPNGRADTESPRTRRRKNPEGMRPRRRPPREGLSGSRRRSRSTFRSGMPEPPAPISNFYNRLFWYGVDPEETTSPADRTMFGGTKGKFNGLSYINSMKDDKYSEGDYWDDDEGLYGESDVPEQRGKLAPRWQAVTPPFDRPTPRTRKQEQKPAERIERSRPRRSSTAGSGDDFRYDESRNDWVSTWFDGTEDENENENDIVSRRRARRSDVSWSGFDFIDSFLGLDRRRLEKQATQYDESMGIGKKRHRRPRPPDSQQRNGYTYGGTLQNDADSNTIDTKADSNIIDTKAVSSDTESKEEHKTERRELTWEDRAAAIERVPPADIPAWGATGDLGVDARTKAITDALEDIAEARTYVEERERKEALLLEEMTILRVDAELEKKRLRKSQLTTKTIQEKLRGIDRQIEDAARNLRYSRLKLKEARDDLSDIQTRHWAVLSFYNPRLAEKGVEEALRELEETEPAVRRFVTKASLDEATGVDVPMSRPDAPVEKEQQDWTTD